ncbi:hypothetical protein Tco_1023892 [Tanacetum coccineum]
MNPAKVKKGIDEIETINIELEHGVAKLLFKNEKLHKEKEHLKKTYKELYDSIKPSRVHAKDQCDSLIVNLNSKSMENADLKAQIQEKVFAIAALENKLKKLKGKTVIDTKVLKNKDARLDYIKYYREHADTLQEIVESTRALSPLDRVIVSTSASGSKLISKTKNNKISQSSSSNKTNKVEDQSRSVKSRKNKKNHVSKTKCNAYFMQSMLNANSKSVCAICNECLFDANHDNCVLDYVHDVNVLSKSKPAKRKNKKQIWKSTVQHKLFQLDDSAIVDLIMALCMFIRSLIINLRVEDLHLGVEKKSDAADELYKFFDRTLKTIRDELYNRKLNYYLGYNKEMSRRKWTTIDKRRSNLMVEIIDKQM